MEMAQKPLVLPDLFTGEKNWDKWIDHFDSIAVVNSWDGEAKLKWLRMRMTTFRWLPEVTRAGFSAATNALQKWNYIWLTCSWNMMEDWAVFGEELNRLADKVYPDFQEEACECSALNQYLPHLDHPQLASV